MSRLASEMGISEVPDEVRGHVDKLGLVYTAITSGDDESWGELVQEARARMRLSLEETGRVIPPGRAEGEGTRGAPPEVAVEPSQPVLEQAAAFAEISGIMANRHPGVRQFRRMHLRHGLLDDAEARQFLDSRCDGPHPTKHGVKAVSRKLWKLAEKLSKTYLWLEGDAVWFILTGYVPPLRPLEVKATITPPPSMALPRVPRDFHPSTARITIIADAWIKAEEVEGAFRDAQRQILGGDAKGPRKARTLEAAKFVARWMQDHPDKKCWEELLRAWNETHPQWHYGDFRGLRQVFERFVHREYNFPNYQRSERTPYQTYRDAWIKGHEYAG